MPSQVPAPNSLEARIADRREKLEKRQTEVFDAPGFEGIFRVELRLIGGKRRFNIAEQYDRLSDEYQKAVRAAADNLVAATVGFYAIDGDTEEPAEEGTTWLTLAKGVKKDLPADTKGRVAIVAILGENGVIQLAEEWMNWMKTRGQKVDQQVARDF